MLVLGVSGAVTALGDTLFPSGSFREGLAQDASPTAHALIRLRIWHPVLAVAVGLAVVYAAGWLRRKRPSPEVRRWAAALVALFVLQLVLGVVNVLLAAPVWMQLVHLLAADLVWIALVLLALAALEPAPAAVAQPRPA
jgi:heme A synthase